MIARRAACAAVLFGMFALTITASAQETRIAPEVRLDALMAERQALQGGVGMNIPAGFYARAGVVAAAGAERNSGGTHMVGRVDILGRFLLDPFGQTRWGLSIGGGVSLRMRGGDRVQPYLLTLVDLEGPHTAGGWSPAFQLGLGGGVRLGAGMRWTAGRSR